MSDERAAIFNWRRALWLLVFFVSLEVIPVTILIDPALLKRYPTLMLGLVLVEFAYLMLCAAVLRSWVIPGAFLGGWFLSQLINGTLGPPSVPDVILGVILGAIAGDLCYWAIKRIK